jgi:hypothetical protein
MWAKEGHPPRGPLCDLCSTRLGTYVRVEGDSPMNASGTLLVVFTTLFCGSTPNTPAAPQHLPGNATVQVAGSGVDHLTTALVHSKVPTSNGMIQRSTEIVDLTGDLKGHVLYHVTSVFDFAQGTLTNSGNQVFSGTIAGSEPVMLHDDQFRFDVNLVTGAENGQVYLVDSIAGPKVRCALEVAGTGMNGDGNPTFTYAGECTFRGQ